MSGAAIADAAGLGEIEIKAMNDDGYDPVFSAAITGGSSIIGPIFPPSIPILLYGSMVGVSVGKLFLAGIVPGCAMALMLFIPAYVISIKRGYPYIPFPGIGPYLKNFLKSSAKGIFPLFTPIIILGSIMFGIATPTEAAVIAVLYSLGLGFFYKSIKLKDIPGIFMEAALDSAIVLFIVSAVSAFSWMLTSKEIPHIDGRGLSRRLYFELYAVRTQFLLWKMSHPVEIISRNCDPIRVCVPKQDRLNIRPIHIIYD